MSLGARGSRFRFICATARQSWVTRLPFCDKTDAEIKRLFITQDFPNTRSAVEDTLGQEAASGLAEKKANPIDHWREEGSWPKEYFEQDDQTRKYLNRDLEEESWLEKYWWPNMSHLLVRKKSSSSIRTKPSEPDSAAPSSTPSDQKQREEKSTQYRHARYELLLKTKGSFMDKSDLGIIDKSRDEYQVLLNPELTVPSDSLFRNDLFESTCRKIRNKNETRVI
jgi:hypothetical protein